MNPDLTTESSSNKSVGDGMLLYYITIDVTVVTNGTVVTDVTVETGGTVVDSSDY